MGVQELQALLRELLQAIEQVAASGEELSDEFQGMLAETLANLFARIQQATQGGVGQTTPPQGATPPLDPGPYPSSNVNSFKYDPRNGNLFVKFHGKDTADSGPTYKYGNVPQYIYDVFSRGAIGPKTSGQNRYHRWIKNVTPSLGGTLNALVKAGGFNYQRVA